MARLRIRIELNRGGVGVPLQKLASVVAESQKFFTMLGEDIHIDQKQGEWLGFDFDHESLNFTAEFVGPVTPEQVQDFYAAFDGTTSLRRATIGQFARITEAIEGDELIGFGLYLGDGGEEPNEWRCLSRRDALRISEGIRMLEETNGTGMDELAIQSHLPAVTDPNLGARLFSERRERALEPAKWAGMVREVEENLSKRIGRLETNVEGHGQQIEDLRSKSTASEESIGRLVSAVEGFCEQATRRLENVPQAALSAPAQLPPPTPSGFQWRSTPVVATAIAVVIIGMSAVLFWPSQSRPEPSKVNAATPSNPAVTPTPVTPAVETPKAATPAPKTAPVVVAKATPKPEASAPRGGVASHLELEALEPSWVSISEEGGKTVMSKLIEPGQVETVDLNKPATLRTGNAGGLTVRLNGTSVGALGAHGVVKEIQFKDGSFKFVAPK